MLVTTVTFDDDGAATRVTPIWTPEIATEIELQTFAANMPAVDQGWTGTFDQLDTFPARYGAVTTGRRLRRQRC